MRVVNQITFEAKDDAEALRLASERLGKDAVILSTRTVRVGGFMGFFQRHVLMLSAGILQDDQKEEKTKDRDKDDVVAKERLVAFQKLLEFKQAAEMRSGSSSTASTSSTSNGNTNGSAKVIYSSTGVKRDLESRDSVHLSSAGQIASSPEKYVEKMEGMDATKLREEVGDLSKRLDMILQHIGKSTNDSSRIDAFSLSDTAKPAEFEAGLPGIPEIDPARHFEKDEFYKKLVEAEIEPHFARQMLSDYRGEKSKEPFEKWLASRIRCAADVSGDVMGGRKVMLLGPTGVGKTTTIAKLAAIQALWEHKNVLLLTSDTYRIAAVDQLRTYAKILGVPIEVVFEVENFAKILEDHAAAELILLDTAGRGQRDRKNLEAFEIIYNVFKPDAVHLVLAANMKYKDMLDVVERMSIIPISHVIFTKLDETVSYGALFNILQTLDCPVSFFTTGQNVPNDIEVASGTRLAALLMGDESRGSTSE